MFSVTNINVVPPKPRNVNLGAAELCDICDCHEPAVRCTICSCVHAACVYNNKDPRMYMPSDVTSDAWKKTWETAATLQPVSIDSVRARYKLSEEEELLAPVGNKRSRGAPKGDKRKKGALERAGDKRRATGELRAQVTARSASRRGAMPQGTPQGTPQATQQDTTQLRRSSRRPV